MKHLLIAFIRLWRAVISPLYGDVCKYHPSCSRYGLQAVQVHGAMRGSWLTIWRILRCNPFSDGGYDPVPGTVEADRWQAEQASRIPGPRPAPSPTNWSVAVATGTSHNTRGEF